MIIRLFWVRDLIISKDLVDDGREEINRIQI